MRTSHRYYVAAHGTDGRSRDDAGGLFGRNSNMAVRDLVDGTSHTLAVGERGAGLSPATWVGRVPDGWSDPSPDTVVESNPPSAPAHIMILGIVRRGFGPNDPDARISDFWGDHRHAGVHFLLADGSVRLLSETTDANVYTALMTRAGGEPVEW